MSRSGDFRGDNDRQTDRQTDYFIPAHARGGNYTPPMHVCIIIIVYKFLHAACIIVLSVPSSKSLLGVGSGDIGRVSWLYKRVA